MLRSAALLLKSFRDRAAAEIYTLSLHDALPISAPDRGGHTRRSRRESPPLHRLHENLRRRGRRRDRKSTRLNSSHANTPYAVYCLKKTNVHSPLLTSPYVRPQSSC